MSVAHIVHPGKKMQELLLGSKNRVKALCGVWVTRGPGRDDDICRSCFEKYNSQELYGGKPGQETAA